MLVTSLSNQLLGAVSSICFPSTGACNNSGCHNANVLQLPSLTHVGLLMLTPSERQLQTGVNDAYGDTPFAPRNCCC